MNSVSNQIQLYETKDLPEYIQLAISQILKENPNYEDPIGCAGLCVKATDNLLFRLDEITESIVDGCMMGDDRPHSWAVIEGWNIDLTARQFDKNDPCPKIWK